MTLEQAESAFHLERSRAIKDLRKPLEDAVRRAERALMVPVIKRPKGPFRRLLMRDFERVRRDYQDRRAALELANSRLRGFDAQVRDRQSSLQHDIRVRTWQRCSAINHAILEAFRNEQTRKDEANLLAQAIADFNRATGEEHELVLAETLEGKYGGTLVDAIELAGKLFARVTSNKGYSYVLFPWLTGMELHVGRPCWYWYDGNGRTRFESQVGTRTPLPRPTS